MFYMFFTLKSMLALYHVMVQLHVWGDYECPSVLCPVGCCSSIRCSTAPAPIRRVALVKLVSVGLFGEVMSAPAATRNCIVEIAKNAAELSLQSFAQVQSAGYDQGQGSGEGPLAETWR